MTDLTPEGRRYTLDQGLWALDFLHFITENECGLETLPDLHRRRLRNLADLLGEELRGSPEPEELIEEDPWADSVDRRIDNLLVAMDGYSEGIQDLNKKIFELTSRVDELESLSGAEEETAPEGTPPVGSFIRNGRALPDVRIVGFRYDSDGGVTYDLEWS